MATKKLNGTVIVTYRCNARCTMCNRYKAPSKPEEEISLETIRKLPPMYFTNITGGEPFIRTDLKDIVRELRKKSSPPTASSPTVSSICAKSSPTSASASPSRASSRPTTRYAASPTATTAATPP